MNYIVTVEYEIEVEATTEIEAKHEALYYDGIVTQLIRSRRYAVSAREKE